MLNTKSSILDPVSNGAENLIKMGKKYIATVRITGSVRFGLANGHGTVRLGKVRLGTVRLGKVW
jgi:hypothetical protein